MRGKTQTDSISGFRYPRPVLLIIGLVLAPCLSSSAQAEHALTNLINSTWRATLETAHGVAAERSTDEVFLRRVYLDVAGRIPTLEERAQFLASPDRSALVEQLLHSDDYAIHFADLFDAVLMGRGGRNRYEERQNNRWREYLENVFRNNRPWNEVAREILLARPSNDADAGAVWYLFERNDNHQAIAEAVAPGFFGVRIDCAQCHDHMIATEIEQQYYWGLVAFFNRGKNVRTDKGPRVVESAVGGFSEFANIEGSSAPNLLTFLNAPVIEEPRPGKDEQQQDSDDLYDPSPVAGEPRVPKFSRREKFVNDVLHDHPLLAKAFVNRAWAMLMGRGIVHPHDQMDSVHGPAIPQLLEELATDFRSSGYDIRRLSRAILLSEPYQLASVRPQGAKDPALFAWHQPRPLTAEQYARSLHLALRGTSEVDIDLSMRLREKLPEVLPENFVTAVGEALYLTNNPALNGFILGSSESHHLVPRVLRQHFAGSDTDVEQDQVDGLIEEIHLTLLNRSPDEEELAALRQFMKGNASKLDRNTVEQRLYHLTWALATAAEFRFNH
jgi:hypothetical protein